MNTKNNIDEFLKQEFDNFTPEAPDVWGGIEQAVQSSSAASTTAAVKTGLLTGKTIAVVAGMIITSGVLVAYNFFSESTSTKQVVAEKQAPSMQETTPQQQPEVSVPQILPAEKVEKDSGNEKQPPSRSKSKKGRNVDDREVKKDIEAIREEMDAKHGVKPMNEGSAQTTADNKEKEETQTPVNQTHIASQPAKNEVNVSQQEYTKADQQHAEPKGPLDATDKEFYKPRIPGSFSPDGMDQFNENFVIEIENEVFFRLLILDRNGKVVFESDSKEKTWNGRNMKNGEECPKGWYFYTLRYRLNGQEESEQVSGKFCLFR